MVVFGERWVSAVGFGDNNHCGISPLVGVVTKPKAGIVEVSESLWVR